VNLLEGDVEITIGGEGEVVILPVNKPRAVIVKKKFKILLIMIRS